MSKIEKTIDNVVKALLAGMNIEVIKYCLHLDNFSSSQIETIIKWAIRINEKKDRKTCDVQAAKQ